MVATLRYEKKTLEMLRVFMDLVAGACSRLYQQLCWTAA